MVFEIECSTGTIEEQLRALASLSYRVGQMSPGDTLMVSKDTMRELPKCVSSLTALSNMLFHRLPNEVSSTFSVETCLDCPHIFITKKVELNENN